GGFPSLAGLTALRLRGVLRTPARSDLAPLATLLARLRTLQISDYWDRQGYFLRGLLAVPELVGLRELDLSGNHIGDRGARNLARSTRPAGLERLYLADNDITDAGSAALRTSTRLGGLRRIDLSRNQLTRAEHGQWRKRLNRK